MGKKTVHPGEWRPLLKAARAAAKHAHAPYSKFRVGAALRARGGGIFSGCNVENISYGLTNCAERTAICSAVARLGKAMKIEAIVVVNARGKPCSPCGGCRQVIYEFGPKAMVYFRSAKGWKSAPITELFPDAFRGK